MSYSASEIVAALYEALLLRQPDPAGLDAGVRKLDEKTLSIAGAIESILTSREFSQNHSAFFQRYVDPSLASFTNDMSQNGEIGLLLRHIVNAGAVHRIVVDVGARGRVRSNSYDLLRHFGWKGLLIEANTHLLRGIEAEFGGLDLTLLNFAVSNRAGSGTFFLGSNDDVSSLRADVAEGWGPVTGQLEIAIERLPVILQSQNIPFDFDVLSIDIEGEDVGVLNDTIATSAYRPRWIIIELPHSNQNSYEGTFFSDAVKERYSVVDHTTPNLILSRR